MKNIFPAFPSFFHRPVNFVPLIIFASTLTLLRSSPFRPYTTIRIAERLFKAARTPAAIASLTESQIDSLIAPCTFHQAKARQIHEIAKQCVSKFHGTLPCKQATLLSFNGVRPKCANLVLGIACGQARIGVDIHVHRVTDRWGYVRERSPEKTMLALERKLPQKYWIKINRLLIPFGKHICTGSRPRCSTCPVLNMCQQVGVKNPR